MCGRPIPKACLKAAPVRGAPDVPRPSAMRRPTSGRNAETSPPKLPSRGISASQPLAVLVSLTLAIEASEAITRCSGLQYSVAPLLLAGGVAVVAPLRLCLWYFRFVSRIVMSASCMWSSGHSVLSRASPAPLTRTPGAGRRRGCRLGRRARRRRRGAPRAAPRPGRAGHRSCTA